MSQAEEENIDLKNDLARSRALIANAEAERKRLKINNTKLIKMIQKVVKDLESLGV